MNSYFSTFTTGFSEVIREALKARLSDVKIDLLLDGLIAYRTDTTYSEIQKLRFFNNTYALIHFLKNSTNKPFSELRDWIKGNKNFEANLDKIINKDTSSIKLIFVEENQYIHLDKFFVNNLLELVTKRVHIEANIQQRDQELWFLVRKEGYSLLGLRLTNRPNYEKTLQKGELKPEIAHLLNLLSELSEKDIFLDPFAGSGAILQERSIAFPFQRIIASDINPSNVNLLKKRFKDSPVEVHKQDALALKTLLGKTQIDKIVTDPPWGLFGEKINIGSFYPHMLEVFHQILKTQGILVVLISKSIEMDKILSPYSNKFKILKKVNTLINGQKATAYKIQKID